MMRDKGFHDTNSSRGCWFILALGIIIVGFLIAAIVLLSVLVRRVSGPQLPDRSPNTATTVRLSNGMELPILGLGTGWTNNNNARQSALTAIDRGYRHLDTAYIYNTEVGIGEAVNAKIAEGVITREDVFVVSKLWKTFMDPQLVRAAVLDSLQNLQLAYVDMYMIHWPMNIPESFDFDFVDTWRELEVLYDEGLIKSLGVCNFNTTQLDYLLDNSRIKPVNNQIESNPHCLNNQLIRHCLSRNVAVTAFSPLGNPGHPQWTPDSRLAINEPNIWSVARRHQKTPAQVMIRYHIQRGIVTIPKSDNHDRVISNFDVFDFHLSQEDIREIESVGFFFRSEWEFNELNHHQFPFATFECL